VAVVQYTFTHKQYTEFRERNIHNCKKKNIIGKCGEYVCIVALLFDALISPRGPEFIQLLVDLGFVVDNV
jgi:hypothetical protein